MWHQNLATVFRQSSRGYDHAQLRLRDLAAARDVPSNRWEYEPQTTRALPVRCVLTVSGQPLPNIEGPRVDHLVRAQKPPALARALRHCNCDRQSQWRCGLTLRTRLRKLRTLTVSLSVLSCEYTMKRRFPSSIVAGSSITARATAFLNRTPILEYDSCFTTYPTTASRSWRDVFLDRSPASINHLHRLQMKEDWARRQASRVISLQT